MYDAEDAERYGAEWKEDFEGVDALVILTDHEEFEELDLEEIAGKTDHKVIVDGRNVLDPREVRSVGFEYFRVGNV